MKSRFLMQFHFAYQPEAVHLDRKSTRLNSSHLGISYAVFCLKKKKKKQFRKINSKKQKKTIKQKRTTVKYRELDTTIRIKRRKITMSNTEIRQYSVTYLLLSR